MQAAATTIVFYAKLAIEARKNQEDRTLGDLFYLLKEEMADIMLSYSERYKQATGRSDTGLHLNLHGS